jgi:hypothetical protein
VPRLVAGASAESLYRLPGPGQWSPRDVLNHLADSDLVICGRATRSTAGWALRRALNLRMYDSLSPAEWQRVGLHSERGLG